MQAQQIFGGHGYIEETGVSQFVRDARIAMIYEGANGVQALDLVGRKLGADGGKPIMAFFELVKGFIKENEADERLKAGFLDPLKAASKDLQAGGEFFLQNIKTPNAALAGSTDFLHLFGHVCLGYMWARMAKAALGRHRRLPRSQARHRALLHGPAPAGDRAPPRPHPVGRRAGDGPSRGGVLMSEYKLHCFAQSGNSYKVGADAGAQRRRLGAGLDRLLPRRDPHAPSTSRSTRWARCRCSSTATCVLTQSGVILDYLAQRYRDFGPKSEEERREVLRWTALGQPQAHLLHRQPALPDEVRPRGEDRPARHRLARPPAPAARSRSSTATCSPRNGSPPTISPSPTSPASATSTTTTSSATTSTSYPEHRALAPGRSPPCPAGSTPTT